MDRKLVISEADEAHQLLLCGLKKLYQDDYFNIRIDVSERNICARLAMHLENIMRERNMFQDCHVDVEYNRLGEGNLKQMLDEEKKRHIISSDILVHTRGILRNILAVEMKKPGNKKFVEDDHNRLNQMVQHENKDNIRFIHNTSLGAFITYSATQVDIEYFSE